MKKVIVIIVATLFFLSARSQNLQFSQVILIDGDVTGPITHTVPAGKVWEIKSWEGGTAYLTVNDKALYLADTYQISSGYPYRFSPNSFWLPENTVIKVGINPTDDDFSSLNYFSIIEYTIVP